MTACNASRTEGSRTYELLLTTADESLQDLIDTVHVSTVVSGERALSGTASTGPDARLASQLGVIQEDRDTMQRQLAKMQLFGSDDAIKRTAAVYNVMSRLAATPVDGRIGENLSEAVVTQALKDFTAALTHLHNTLKAEVRRFA